MFKLKIPNFFQIGGAPKKDFIIQNKFQQVIDEIPYYNCNGQDPINISGNDVTTQMGGTGKHNKFIKNTNYETLVNNLKATLDASPVMKAMGTPAYGQRGQFISTLAGNMSLLWDNKRLYEQMKNYISNLDPIKLTEYYLFAKNLKFEDGTIMTRYTENEGKEFKLLHQGFFLKKGSNGSLLVYRDSSPGTDYIKDTILPGNPSMDEWNSSSFYIWYLLSYIAKNVIVKDGSIKLKPSSTGMCAIRQWNSRYGFLPRGMIDTGYEDHIPTTETMGDYYEMVEPMLSNIPFIPN
jgi:hypothetical protein